MHLGIAESLLCPQWRTGVAVTLSCSKMDGALPFSKEEQPHGIPALKTIRVDRASVEEWHDGFSVAALKRGLAS